MLAKKQKTYTIIEDDADDDADVHSNAHVSSESRRKDNGKRFRRRAVSEAVEDEEKKREIEEERQKKREIEEERQKKREIEEERQHLHLHAGIWRVSCNFNRSLCVFLTTWFHLSTKVLFCCSALFYRWNSD
ncbi:unnamed protein product [Cuscuta epithymum]|uniref:Uncharacterized protein n=1 Tax=Cuscuta epithymum TaxID=186058 RepID=A0AAV0GG34_9ASTE|nr:unnamed protein product [Cuscuta epithymum]